MDKYELIKTIGFELKPIKTNGLEKFKLLKKEDNPEKKRRVHLKSFIDDIEHFIYCFEDFVFIDDSGKKKTPESTGQKKYAEKTEKNKTRNLKEIYIKYDWLLNYTKDEFFSWYDKRNKRSKFNIKTVDYLKQSLQKCIQEWRIIIEDLKGDLNAPKETLNRRSKTALSISQFSKKQNFPFIKNFVLRSKSHTNEQQRVNLEKLLEKIDESLIKIRELYLPFQSTGLVVAKASFNYYTINKEPKNYEEEIKECNREINAVNRYIKINFHGQIKQWIYKNTDEEVKQFLNNSGLKADSELKALSLKTSCGLLKLYKFKIKSLFNEDVSRGLSYQDIKEKHPLFVLNENKESKYNELVSRIKEIERLNLKINQVKNSRVNQSQIKEERRENTTKTKKYKVFSIYPGSL